VLVGKEWRGHDDLNMKWQYRQSIALHDQEMQATIGFIAGNAWVQEVLYKVQIAKCD
jgi:hypothetical protein